MTRTRAVQGDDLGRLMIRAQSGDAAAYRALLQVLTRLLRGHIRKRAPQLQACDVEDVVQEILISVHEARASYDPARPFPPWLFALARHRLADHARRHTRNATGAAAFRDLAETFAAQQTNITSEGVEMAMTVRSAMSELPEGQRKAVEMLRIRQLSLAEAEAQSGLSQGALKVALHRGVKRLRASILGGDG